MARPDKLETSEIEARLRKPEFSGWTSNSGSIERKFKFVDFSEAWGFMCRAALAAEKMDHHPDWTNVYNEVHVSLNTHSAGGVTELDFQLAQIMSSLVQK